MIHNSFEHDVFQAGWPSNIILRHHQLSFLKDQRLPPATAEDEARSRHHYRF